MFGKLESRVIIVVDSKYAVRFHTKAIYLLIFGFQYSRHSIIGALSQIGAVRALNGSAPRCPNYRVSTVFN